MSLGPLIADLALRLGEAAVKDLLEVLLNHPDPREAMSIAIRKARAEAIAAQELEKKFGSEETTRP